MVKEIGWSVIWELSAVQDLKDAHAYIKEKSPHAATKVLERINSRAQELSINPFVFEKDRFRIPNTDGLFRAIEVFS